MVAVNVCSVYGTNRGQIEISFTSFTILFTCPPGGLDICLHIASCVTLRRKSNTMLRSCETMRQIKLTRFFLICYCQQPSKFEYSCNSDQVSSIFARCSSINLVPLLRSKLCLYNPSPLVQPKHQMTQLD